MRTRIAHEAARLMRESGIKDYALAKRKAAQRLQVATGAPLPRNEEIEEAIAQHQRLFQSERHAQRLDALRAAALEAMRFFSRFEPYLVGSVLRGTADEHSEVNLHLFAEPTEEVGLYLMERGVPHELGERRFRFSPDDARAYPAYRFLAGALPIEAVVFPYQVRRHAPLSPVDGRPMGRAGLARVEALCSDPDD